MAIRATITNNLNFGGFNDLLQKHVDKALNKIGYALMIYARNNHRYQSRSGNLINSTRFSVNKTISRVRLYISEGQAEYGKYVHEGHGTWSADRFIDDAIIKNKQFIDDEMNEAVRKATIEFNRQNRI
jgi:hypothetical protein